MAENIQLQRAYMQWAVQAQKDDEAALQLRRDFFMGEAGVPLTEKQREILGPLADDVDRSLCNIAKRAVQIPLERLEIEQIEAKEGTGGEAFATLATEWMEANEKVSPDKREQFSQYDVHESALRDSISCVIVGWDGERPTYTRNELYDGVDGQIRLHFSPDTGALLFASKRWQTFDPLKPLASGKTRLTLYEADQITRYEADTNTPGGWRVLDVAEIGDENITANPEPWLDIDGNPLGIPVIPFWNPGGSEMDDILANQRLIDKSIVDVMSANGAYGFPRDALIGFMGDSLAVAPGYAIKVPIGGDVKRLPGADLSPMFNVVTMGMIQIASIIKGWPVYLWTRGEVPSGEALKVLEASLISQVQRKQEYLEASWLSCFELGRKLYRKFGGEELTGELKIAWRNPETRNDKLKWEEQSAFWSMVKNGAASVPIQVVLERAGLSEAEVNEIVNNPEFAAMQQQKADALSAAGGFNRSRNGG